MASKYQLHWSLKLVNWLLKRAGSWSEETLAETRSREASDLFTRGFQRKIELHNIENQEISGRHGAIPIRIYQPGAKQDLPLIVFYHGGGWTIGNLDSHDYICRRIAQECEAVIVSVDYRLAPEHKYPIAVEESYDALCWVAKNATELGANPEKLIVMGDSAGGNLAAVMTLIAREKQEPHIAGQVLIYPSVDSTNDERPSRIDYPDAPILPRSAMDFFIKMYTHNEEQWGEAYLSPMCAENHRDLPPALIQVAEYDPLRDEGIAYAETLRAAGVAAKDILYPRMVHGFFSVGAFLPETKKGYQDIANFVKHLA